MLFAVDGQAESSPQLAGWADVAHPAPFPFPSLFLISIFLPVGSLQHSIKGNMSSINVFFSFFFMQRCPLKLFAAGW